MIPSIVPHRTYYDPELWLRLAPKIETRQVELMLHMADGRWQTLEDGKLIVGELKGLKWVMDNAAELTRIEDGE